MRSFCIVVVPPCFSGLTGFLNLHEPGAVEAFVSELSVERLNECILDRLAWVDVMELDSALFGPRLRVFAAKLRSIVDDNFGGFPAAPKQPI